MKLNSKKPELATEQHIQNFYLNPEYKEKVFDILPRSNLTIKNAVIFEPQVIEQQFSPELKDEFDQLYKNLEFNDGEEYTKKKEHIQNLEKTIMNKAMRATPMQLLVKNNLTIIEPVELRGYGTSGILELKDIKKTIIKPRDQMYDFREAEDEIVSVKDMLKHGLVACEHISPYTNMLNWTKLSLDSGNSNRLQFNSIMFDHNIANKTLNTLLSGTELYVNNYLFDDKTQAEWLRIKDKPNQIYSISDQIIASNHYQKNYLKKNDRLQMSLGMQNFKNYIPFNIPITDIFKKKLDSEDTKGTLFFI